MRSADGPTIGKECVSLQKEIQLRLDEMIPPIRGNLSTHRVRELFDIKMGMAPPADAMRLPDGFGVSDKSNQPCPSCSKK
jgi:hypothetical protein